MRALHVVGIDFQLRLCIDLRFTRKQKIFVGLLRVSLLRAVANKNLAIENRARLAIQNPLVKLATGAMRLAMINYRMRVGMLTAFDHIETVD